jgi:hypothetical protein
VTAVGTARTLNPSRAVERSATDPDIGVQIFGVQYVDGTVERQIRIRGLDNPDVSRCRRRVNCSAVFAAIRTIADPPDTGS